MTIQSISISVISPVFMAEDIVDELVKRISEELTSITNDYEVILVEDGSRDQSWKKIEQNCHQDKRVKGIKLSRNFGQHYAIAAGLMETKGDFVIVMDCDLQDDPKYISNLLKKAIEGYDIVYTIKQLREHNKIKNFFARSFNSIFNWLIGNKNIQSDGLIGSYSLITRKVVDAYKSLNDYHKPYLIILQWLGFSSTHIRISHSKRFSGKSSYNFRRLIKHAINGILSQTDRLLKISIYVGFFISIIGLISIIYIVISYFNGGFQSGWASVVVVIIFSTGVILMSLGVIGAYLGKIFEQVKGRPLYVVERKINT